MTSSFRSQSGLVPLGFLEAVLLGVCLLVLEVGLSSLSSNMTTPFLVKLGKIMLSSVGSPVSPLTRLVEVVAVAASAVDLAVSDPSAVVVTPVIAATPSLKSCKSLPLRPSSSHRARISGGFIDILAVAISNLDDFFGAVSYRVSGVAASTAVEDPFPFCCCGVGVVDGVAKMVGVVGVLGKNVGLESIVVAVGCVVVSGLRGLVEMGFKLNRWTVGAFKHRRDSELVSANILVERGDTDALTLSVTTTIRTGTSSRHSTNTNLNESYRRRRRHRQPPSTHQLPLRPHAFIHPRPQPQPCLLHPNPILPMPIPRPYNYRGRNWLTQKTISTSNNHHPHHHNFLMIIPSLSPIIRP